MHTVIADLREARFVIGVVAIISRTQQVPLRTRHENSLGELSVYLLAAQQASERERGGAVEHLDRVGPIAPPDLAPLFTVANHVGIILRRVGGGQQTSQQRVAFSNQLVKRQDARRIHDRHRDLSRPVLPRVACGRTLVELLGRYRNTTADETIQLKKMGRRSFAWGTRILGETSSRPAVQVGAEYIPSLLVNILHWLYYTIAVVFCYS